MAERSKKLLVQMQEIVDFTGIAKVTIKKMHETVGFPAKKLNGTWYSSTDAIEQWMFNNCYPAKKKPKK
jgi:predicted DNA-binding transcriptional regulator AlpA